MIQCKSFFDYGSCSLHYINYEICLFKIYYFCNITVSLITLYYQTEFGTAIFEDVADVCYNMLDHLEQYKQYLESMKLIHIPLHVKATVSTSSNIPTVTADQLPGSQSTTATQGQ